MSPLSDASRSCHRHSRTPAACRSQEGERLPSVVQPLIRSARYPLPALGAASRGSIQVGLIPLLIAASPAVHTFTFAAIRSLAEDPWRAGCRLPGVCLLLCLHAHAPRLFWTIVLFLVLPISLMLLWAVSSPSVRSVSESPCQAAVVPLEAKTAQAGHPGRRELAHRCTHVPSVRLGSLASSCRPRRLVASAGVLGASHR
jgi:hypothetical protein